MEWKFTDVPQGRTVTSGRVSQAKVLTEGGDLREAQIDVPPSGSRSCV